MIFSKLMELGNHYHCLVLELCHHVREISGIPLVVPWLRAPRLRVPWLRAPVVKTLASPAGGAKIPHDLRQGQKKKKKRENLVPNSKQPATFHSYRFSGSALSLWHFLNLKHDMHEF